LHGYDWEHTHINLDNKVFEEVFRVFNLYNFTVREDEPLEKEVAVDPEMLGKVFENLLEIKDRKSKGAYYTPREIVHYMCQESLINYLDTALNAETEKVDKEDIEGFIREGDLSIERDQAREEGKLRDDEYGLPASIREHAREIDFALADVKICDPAIGSGAFPVGMMTEIVRSRSVLTSYLQNQRNRDAYTFKWHCIENSLYGVDIEPSAVEIAKLRLWLSLVVDEDSYDQIRPLPNLDYRIVCGNSLLSVEKNLFNYTLYPELEKKKLQYFGTTSSKNKKALRYEIENLIDQLTEGKMLFGFEVYFSEVFSVKQGFDVVIGNPPYVGQKGNKELFWELKNTDLGKRFHQRRMDLFYFFFHLSLDISNKKSIISIISTNYFLTATFADKLRKDIKNRAKIIELINFNECKIFETALGQHNVVTILTKNQDYIKNAKTLVTNFPGIASSADIRRIVGKLDNNTNYFSVPQDEIFEGIENYIRVRGNSRDAKSLEESILIKVQRAEYKLIDLCNISTGIQTGADKIRKKHLALYEYNASVGDGIFVLNKNELINKGIEITSEFVKPWYKNSDISRYVVSEKPKLYVLYLKDKKEKQTVDDEIVNHLKSFKELLIDRLKVCQKNKFQWNIVSKWLERGEYYLLFYPRKQEVFEAEKIVVVVVP
ncbi:MAG: Eco57I restriction-modification methylase domain-containing protein, partial [Candidatus Helarchaeota archaeon]